MPEGMLLRATLPEVLPVSRESSISKDILPHQASEASLPLSPNLPLSGHIHSYSRRDGLSGHTHSCSRGNGAAGLPPPPPLIKVDIIAPNPNVMVLPPKNGKLAMRRNRNAHKENGGGTPLRGTFR